jgi:6,7-dimethyl-8-ribityllumazine synthase
MMRTQIAYVQAKWHSNIVSKSLDGFRAALPDADVASFEVPGAFEMPLIAKELAKQANMTPWCAPPLLWTVGFIAMISWPKLWLRP